MGRAFQKRFAGSCHKENFLGQVSIYITANVLSLPLEDHHLVMASVILRGNPISGLLIKILQKSQNKEATHTKVSKVLSFSYEAHWSTLLVIAMKSSSSSSLDRRVYT